MSNLTKDEYVKGILDGNTTILARAITLVESQKYEHQTLASEILNEIIPFTGHARRIGVSGIPGVGKSTFIETFGMALINQQKAKVAVLAVDPSSEKTGGSILGDKTRMSELSQNTHAFIRPTPSAGHLGGVARKTRESALLCEAAGFDTIIIETVGVGQSETMVAQMVDFFLLLLQPGAGDDLQGIKRGIMEVAHLICVNKSDGENESLSKVARHEYENALHILRSNDSWIPSVIEISALYKKGLDKVSEILDKFFTEQKEEVQSVRKKQELLWLHEIINEKFLGQLESMKEVNMALQEMEQKVLTSEVSASYGASFVFQTFIDNIKSSR